MQPTEVKRILVVQWLDKAHQDLAAARMLIGSDAPLPYPACFHAQQAAEKFLKAFLTFHQIEFPKTHNIGELLNLAGKAAADLPTILTTAAALTPYGVELRYPGDAPAPDEAEAKSAIALAEKVRDEILVLISA